MKNLLNKKQIETKYKKKYYEKYWDDSNFVMKTERTHDAAK